MSNDRSVIAIGRGSMTIIRTIYCNAKISQLIRPGIGSVLRPMPLTFRNRRIEIVKFARPRGSGERAVLTHPLQSDRTVVPPLEDLSLSRSEFSKAISKVPVTPTRMRAKKTSGVRRRIAIVLSLFGHFTRPRTEAREWDHSFSRFIEIDPGCPPDCSCVEYLDDHEACLEVEHPSPCDHTFS